MSETTTDENEGSAQGSDQGTQGADDSLVKHLLDAGSKEKKHHFQDNVLTTWPCSIRNFAELTVVARVCRSVM